MSQSDSEIKSDYSSAEVESNYSTSSNSNVFVQYKSVDASCTTSGGAWAGYNTREEFVMMHQR